jgi:hypothetical protein
VSLAPGAIVGALSYTLFAYLPWQTGYADSHSRYRRGGSAVQTVLSCVSGIEALNCDRADGTSPRNDSFRRWRRHLSPSASCPKEPTQPNSQETCAAQYLRVQEEQSDQSHGRAVPWRSAAGTFVCSRQGSVAAGAGGTWRRSGARPAPPDAAAMKATSSSGASSRPEEPAEIGGAGSSEMAISRRVLRVQKTPIA